MTGEELKAYRTSIGYTQKEFAELIGVRRIATVADYERGIRTVPETVARLVQARKELAALQQKK